MAVFMRPLTSELAWTGFQTDEILNKLTSLAALKPFKGELDQEVKT